MIEGRRDSDGEPFMMPLGGVLDSLRLFRGPIPKEQIEDLQLWSALQALASQKGTRHPLSTRPIVPDPPDRVIAHETREWPTELTELTIEDLRGDLFRMRSIGRVLQDRLRDRHADFKHLDGRTVMLAKQDGQDLPKNTGILLDQVTNALTQDKGFIGEDLGSGPDMGRGIYGSQGPISVTVNQAAQNGEVTVSATSQSPIFRSEVIRALGKRVEEKDEPQNELVIVSCGLPDKQGYACPYDHAIFLTLQKAVAEGMDILPNPPKHIRGGLIHLWDTEQLIAWGEGTDFPWASDS
jgi:hypothetical protein